MCFRALPYSCIAAWLDRMLLGLKSMLSGCDTNAQAVCCSLRSRGCDERVRDTHVCACSHRPWAAASATSLTLEPSYCWTRASLTGPTHRSCPSGSGVPQTILSRWVSRKALKALSKPPKDKLALCESVAWCFFGRGAGCHKVECQAWGLIGQLIVSVVCTGCCILLAGTHKRCPTSTVTRGKTILGT